VSECMGMYYYREPWIMTDNNLYIW